MATEAMAPADWSSLPADLVRRVADCFLSTNDLDCYMDLRAVCHNWRSATADPKSSPPCDPRFRPSRWVMLDEQNTSNDDELTSTDTDETSCLFVNTSTGRFVRKSLPLLQSHCFVTTTTGGFLILADSNRPHAVRVLNPFTGCFICFSTPLPPEPRFVAEIVGGSSSPTLVLLSVSSNMVYWADPRSERFSAEKHLISPANRLPLIAASKNPDGGGYRVLLPVSPAEVFGRRASEEGCRAYVVEAAGGEMLSVLRRRHGVDVFKIGSDGKATEQVNNIGSRALFLGIRSFVVDTDRFPSIEANRVYFQLTDLGVTALPVSETDIYTYDIGLEIVDEDDEEPEHVSAAIDADSVWRRGVPPFTILQLLSNYTMDIPRHLLRWENHSFRNSCYTDDISEVDFYQNYVDYVEHDEDWDESYYDQPDWEYDQYKRDF